MTRERLLLIGEDFGNADTRYHSDIYALTGKSGRRLASLMGFEGDDAMLRYALATERTNVVTVQPQWKDHALVAENVIRIGERARHRKVILLGVRVAGAFGYQNTDMMTWLFDPNIEAWVARMPHPSGRSHWWNEEANVIEASRFLRDALENL